MRKVFVHRRLQVPGREARALEHSAELSDLRRDRDDAIGVFSDHELGVRTVDDVRARPRARWEECHDKKCGGCGGGGETDGETLGEGN